MISITPTSSPLVSILAVGCGGALGAMLRFGLVGAAMHFRIAPGPVAILFVNVAGCFAMGLAFGMLPTEPAWIRQALCVGLLGGLTTFSAFGLDTWALLSGGRAGWALAYVAASVVIGIAALWVGIAMTGGMVAGE